MIVPKIPGFRQGFSLNNQDVTGRRSLLNFTREGEKLLGVQFPPIKSGFAEHLLRKEVIHPHLPVRIPCYDLVLVAEFTLGPLTGYFGYPQLR